MALNILGGLAAGTSGLSAAGTVGQPDGPEWAVDPSVAGADLPPTGRSLFDYLVTVADSGRRVYRVPFPFEDLTAQIGVRLRTTSTQALQQVLIPIGRSLQRNAANPHYFESPRAVVSAESDPIELPGEPLIMLKDRLHLGYQPAAAAIEVISWNEAAGRFEFQIVEDYRPGGKPTVRYVPRALCTGCHQNQGPIFADEPWNESNSNPNIAQVLETLQPAFYGIPARTGLDIPGLIDFAVERGNYMPVYQRIWRAGCGADDPDGIRCRGGALLQALLFRLAANRTATARDPLFESMIEVQRRSWQALWPNGLAIPSGRLLDRDPFTVPELNHIRFHLGPVSTSRMLTELRAKMPTTVLSIEDSLEPLYERPPHAIWSWPAPLAGWNSSRPPWFDGFIAGLADYFAPQDIARLDDRIHALASQAGRAPRDLRAVCQVTRPSTADMPVRFECGAATDLEFLMHIDVDAPQPTGRITGFHLAGVSGAGDMEIVSAALSRDASGRHADLTVRAVNGGVNPREQGPRLHARLSNGETIQRIRIDWSALEPGGRGDGRVTVTLIEDFGVLRDAVSWMVDETAAGRLDALADRPYRRVAVLAPLFDRLGIAGPPWCCIDTAGFPPAELSTD